MAKRKSWAQKLNEAPQGHVSRLEKSFGGFPPGSALYIASPLLVRDYMAAIPAGKTRTITMMREDFAKANHADGTCPLTSSIFARIAAEAALDEMRAGAKADAITPFWRLIEPGSTIAEKLSCDDDFIAHQRSLEAGAPL